MSSIHTKMERLRAVSPVLSESPLGQYASLLWHAELSPLRFGRSELDLYCLNVGECIAGQWESWTVRRLAWHGMYVVALDAVVDRSLLCSWRESARYVASVCLQGWETAARREGAWVA